LTKPSVDRPKEHRAALETGKYKTGESFRLMVDSVLDYAFVMLDPEGRIATWNRGAERIVLYRADEVIGKHFSIFYPPESIENGLPQRELAMARANGRNEDEGWRLRRGGARYWANVVITALRDEQGQLVGFCKVSRDLSERRRAEQGLATAYDQVNSVLECTSDGVIMIDRNWSLVYGNRKAAESLPDFYIGKNYWDCFPGVKGTPLEDTLRKSMAERSAAAYETYYAPYQQWFRGNVFPTPEGLSVFFANVTTEKALQVERAREQFLKEKRIEALSHMAGGLAHEINNPLAIIHATAVDLMNLADGRASLPSEEVRTGCERIVKTSNRAIRILRALKGFGRDAEKDPMETTSIYEVLDQCVELQGVRFERHKVELRLKLKPDLPYIECRETQICQIITNLINNGFDAVIDEAGKERWVTVSAEHSGKWISVDVTDSGPGIKDEIKAHLMEPFFTTKEAGKGMGIGLSLSRAIAQEHGGTLTVFEEGPHTCFRLILPVSAESEPQEKENSGGRA
jgi:PAS domain S-box-containing protein